MMQGARMGFLGGLTTSAACLLAAGCIPDGAIEEDSDGWVDSVDDPLADLPDFPDEETRDTAEEDASCAEGRVECGGVCADSLVDEIDCTSSEDCGDECPCTIDSCNPATGTCEYFNVCATCETDYDCYDGDPCTIDSCVPTECGCHLMINFCNNSPDPACG